MVCRCVSLGISSRDTGSFSEASMNLGHMFESVRMKEEKHFRVYRRKRSVNFVAI